MFCIFLMGCKYDKNNEFYPKAITFITIVQDELQIFGVESISDKNLVIKTEYDWNNLINKMMTVSNSELNFSETEIDFSEYQVIVVFDEVRNTCGFTVDITDITEYEDRIEITYKNLGSGNLMYIINQPFHFVKIPASTKNLIFKNECIIKEDNYPMFYSLDGNICKWTFLYDNNETFEPFEGIVNIINSNEELINYVTCSNFPIVDFSQKTLLLAYGYSNRMILYIPTILYQQVSEKNFSMKIVIQSGGGNAFDKWVVALLIPKITSDIIVTLDVTQGGYGFIGTGWNIKTLCISDELTIVSRPTDAINQFMSIIIPENNILSIPDCNFSTFFPYPGTLGQMLGYSFQNFFIIDFEMKDNNQIRFKNLRPANMYNYNLEDIWGIALEDNLNNTVTINMSNNELIFMDVHHNPTIVFNDPINF